MRQGKHLFLVAFAAAALLWAAAPAEAQWRGGWGRGGWGGWGGGYGGYYGRGFYGGYWGRPGFSLGIGYGGYYPGYAYGSGYYGYTPGYAYSYPSYYYSTPSYYYSTPTYYTEPAYVPSTAAPAVAAAAAAPATREASYYAPPTDNTARVRVNLPPDATLTVDGQATQQRGGQRDFVTPALTPGQDYVYTMTARWAEGGQPAEQTKKVYVRANGTADVTFGTER